MRLCFLFCSIAISLAATPADSRLPDAAQQQDRKAVSTLLRQKADPNARQADGTTALHWAVENDDLEMVRLLLAAGADAKAANRYTVTPLSLACENGNGQIASLLLAAGADANLALPGGETPLMTAARSGRLDAVKALLKAGANVNAKETRMGQTALMWAAAEGHAAVVELLIEFGADFRAKVDSGYTPYLFAVRAGQIEAARSLLKAGADINQAIEPAKGRRPGGKAPRAGTSALVLAVLNGHFEMASALLDAGADPNSAGSGWTALHAITGVRKTGIGDNDPPPIGLGNMTSLEMVRKLVSKGANINARMTRKINVGLTGLNTNGCTPFLLAARTADVELMKLLLELGADAKIPNADNANAAIIAAGLGTRSPGEDPGSDEEVIEALKVVLAQGVDINAVDNNGETAMHGAAYKNLPKVAEFLGANGARIEIWNQKNKYGWTPLVVAQGHRFGNYKPSPVTVAAIMGMMNAAGVPIPPEPVHRGYFNVN